MTDVIEDAENIVQRAIDLLETFLNRLIVRLNQNVHRPLNRRTLLRWIAAFFPSPLNPRIKIGRQMGLQSHMMSRWASCGSLPYTGSESTFHDMVEEDLGDNVVRYRMTGKEYSDDDEIFDDDANPFMESFNLNRLTSTPNLNASSCSSLASSQTAESQSKISEMEEELATLRKQIAMLVVAQENTTLSKTVTESDSKEVNVSQIACIPLPQSPAGSNSPNDSGCDINRPLSSCSEETSEPPIAAAPAPPLPPPPPPPPFLVPPPPPISGLRKSSFDPSDLMKKRTSLKSMTDTTKSNVCINEVPRMSDVLKGLSSVKLKFVERSPGGTPFRTKPRCDPCDPASIIAQALKRKFAHHQGFFSPDSDKENDSSFSAFPSPDQITPKSSKTAKRRLSLLASREESESLTPVAHPHLQTLNV